MDPQFIQQMIASIRHQVEELERHVESQEPPLIDPKDSVPPFRDRSASEGMHRLNDWPTSKFFGEQCKYLVTHLSTAIDATKRFAPERSAAQGFRLLNPGGRISDDDMNEDSEERRLEAALFRRWGLTGDWEASKVDELWRAIGSKQVPLFDSRKKDGWGHIDLLAVGHDNAPVVVELKKGTNKEPLLRPVLEGVSYALALEKVWVPFMEEYTQLLEGLSDFNPDFSWSTKQVAIIAPSGYWEYWQRPRYPREKVASGWASFHQLIGALAEAGIQVTFWQCPDLQPDGTLGPDNIVQASGPWTSTYLR